MMALADNRDGDQLGQLTTPELDAYGGQLTRCLDVLGASAPIRADVQRELAAIRAERASRSMATEPHDPRRQYQVGGLATRELERIRRELQANLGLMRANSPAHVPVLAYMRAIEMELGDRAERAPS